jgi:hypothetical protein
MSRHVQRALIGNTATHPRDDANYVRKADTADCQYRKKRLCRRCFRSSHIERSQLARCRCDSSMAAESALRGL